MIKLLVLIDDNWILKEVADVYHFTTSDDFRVFLTEEPSHVSEEETPFSIIWIGISFTKFLMHPVISTPDENAVLSRKGLSERDEKS